MIDYFDRVRRKRHRRKGNSVFATIRSVVSDSFWRRYYRTTGDKLKQTDGLAKELPDAPAMCRGGSRNSLRWELPNAPALRRGGSRALLS
jgi:hypothetical protein